MRHRDTYIIRLMRPDAEERLRVSETPNAPDAPDADEQADAEGEFIGILKHVKTAEQWAFRTFDELKCLLQSPPDRSGDERQSP